MDFSKITVLLARQRSGTSVLRSVLDSNPDIHCYNEIFNYNQLTFEGNYFEYLSHLSRCELSPEKNTKNFISFLHSLYERQKKEQIVIDVKYNSCHYLSEPWQRLTAEPVFFRLIKDKNIKLCHLKRHNYLRYIVSNALAVANDKWQMFGNDKMSITCTCLNAEYVWRTLCLCREEDRYVEDAFSSYGNYASFEYADLFPATQQHVSESVLDRLSVFMGVHNSFNLLPKYRKQVSQSLKEVIENYEEIDSLLKDTEFEYCLNDE